MSKKRYGNELHPLYSRWLSTKQRCNNPNNANYKNYGGRGIYLSDDLSGFIGYRDYIESLDGYGGVGRSLDRINNNLGYQKGNLRWTNQGVQIANQRFSGKGSNSYTGVNWNKCKNRWVARIWLGGKSLFVKDCKTEEIALNERNKFIKENNLPHTVQELIK